MKRNRLLLAIATVGIATSGCERHPAAPESSEAEPVASVASSQAGAPIPWQTVPDDFSRDSDVRLAASMDAAGRGFGGVWVEDGEVVVAMTRVGESNGAARRMGALASRARLASGLSTTELVRHEKRGFEFDFVQLVEWKVALMKAIPDLPWLDIKERQNIIEVGSDTPSRAKLIRDVASDLEIPSSALRLVDPPDLEAAVGMAPRTAQAPINQLDQYVRPTPAGVVIRKPNGNACTYTGAVDFDSGSYHFNGIGLTNAHCSDFVGSGLNSAEKIYQPDDSYGVFAREIVDPEAFDPPWWYTCNPSHLCRLSDAALFELEFVNWGAINEVAWPDPPLPSGDVFWPGEITRPIVGTWYFPYRDHMLGDVWTLVSGQDGRIEGAQVVDTCSSGIIQTPLGPFTILCAHGVNVFLSQGASGSPVLWDAPAYGGLIHAGIAFARSTTYGPRTYYSDWFGINGDLESVDPGYGAKSCDGSGGTPAC